MRSRYAWSFVISWAMVPFLPAHGNAQSRCDSPACDCRTGQATPCDAVGGIGSRSFDSLMLPSLAEATLRNTDRLGNSIESATLKWIERSKQLSARWRFSESSCDASCPSSRACGSEHPPIDNHPADESAVESSAPAHAPQWTELPMASNDSVATPTTPGQSSSPVWMHQTPGTLEVPQPNKQNPLIDPFIDDPQPAAPIIPNDQGIPLGQRLRQRGNQAMPSPAIDVPPVWIASGPAVIRRSSTAIAQPQQPLSGPEPAPTDVIRQASDSQPIRDPSVSAGSKTSAQTPRNKRRPKPFEPSQRGQMPTQPASPAPSEAAAAQTQTKPLPAPAMQSYEEFAKRLQSARSSDSLADEPTSQTSTVTSSNVALAKPEGKSDSALEPLNGASHIPALTSEPSLGETKAPAPTESPEAEVHGDAASEPTATVDEGAINSALPESMGDEDTELPEDASSGSGAENDSDGEKSNRTDSVRPNEDAASLLDARITQRILNQLQIAKDQGTLKKFELDVSTVDGEVWVRGFVSRPEHKQLILDTIQQVPGVVLVIDDVSVARPMPAPRKQEIAEESLGSADPEKPTPRSSPSASGAINPDRGLALPKWLRQKATGDAKENTDFRSTLQSPHASNQSQEWKGAAPRGRSRGAFGAADRVIGAAPLSSPVVPIKPKASQSSDRSTSAQIPIASPTEDLQRRSAAASAIPDGRADIDRKTKARLAATAARVDQPTAGTSGPSKLSVPQPPAAPGESPAAATNQGAKESNSEQGLDLNSFLQRVNAAKQQKDRPE